MWPRLVGGGVAVRVWRSVLRSFLPHGFRGRHMFCCACVLFCFFFFTDLDSYQRRKKEEKKEEDKEDGFVVRVFHIYM